MSTEAGTELVWLKPRPYAKFSGRLLLLPLLSIRKIVTLPNELWFAVFQFCAQHKTAALLPLLTVCKKFKELALPLVYTEVELHRLYSLQSFFTQLVLGDQKWDSLRRIPLSTPGRWVQYLDLSEVVLGSQHEALRLDSMLTTLFPLMPFLVYLSLNPSFILSRRAILALAEREGAANLRCLNGVAYLRSMPSNLDDPLVKLVASCSNLEELEIIGQGSDPIELELGLEPQPPTLPTMWAPLNLPQLRCMTLLSMHTSPLMLALLMSPLPSLQKLTVTPYDDIPSPASHVSRFISVHGQKLRSLFLLTPKSWPTRLHPSPTGLLQDCPAAHYISLENPVPQLSLSRPHPLQILSIPRPTPEAWVMLDRIISQLPSLKVVRARDVRWLRKGTTSRALEAGVQGDMWEWSRRLARSKISFVDADWKEREVN